VFRNLAVEEALAHALSTGLQTQSTLRVWSNPRAVVVGRFQEISNEVDLRQCNLNDVAIARRFTGGGTVFHDEATLNLTIAKRLGQSTANLSFQEGYLCLVSEAINDLGIRSSTSRNSILFDGRKLCGAAAAVGPHFALWHCSILVGTDTGMLERVLAPSKSAVKSRFVHSRWQQVTTLRQALSKPISIEKVTASIEKKLEAKMGIRLRPGQLGQEEEQLSQALYESKYYVNKWNLEGNRGFGTG